MIIGETEGSLLLARTTEYYTLIKIMHLLIFLLTIASTFFYVFGNPSPPTLDASQKQSVANLITRQSRRLGNNTCQEDSVLAHKVDPVGCGKVGIIIGKTECKGAAVSDSIFDSGLKFEERNNFPDAHKPQGCLYDKSSNAYVYNDINTGLGDCTSEFQCVCREQICKKCPHGTVGDENAKICSSNNVALILVPCVFAFFACLIMIVVGYRFRKWNNAARRNFTGHNGTVSQNQQHAVPIYYQQNTLASQGMVPNGMQAQQNFDDPYSLPQVPVAQVGPIAQPYGIQQQNGATASVPNARPMVPPDAPDYDVPLVQPIVNGLNYKS